MMSRAMSSVSRSGKPASHAPLWRPSSARVAEGASPAPDFDFGAIAVEGRSSGLSIGRVDDPAEAEADRAAEQAMRGGASPSLSSIAAGVQRMCAACAAEAEEKVQRKADASVAHGPARAPPIVREVLQSPGQPLDPETRGFMERRFGHDFGRVRVHADSGASRSAEAVAARAYTVGEDVVFRRGEYRPGSPAGRRLLAHELAHVVQQDGGAAPATTVRRQGMEQSTLDSDLAAERAYGNKAAPKAMTCGRPSWCPAGFCSPYASQPLAEYYRAKNAFWLMAGISVAVNSRVVPLWKEYLWGGSSPKNLTADFGADFSKSPTTMKTTRYLYDELKKSLSARPPVVSPNSNTTLDVAAQIPSAVAALDDPASPNQMNFNIPKDIPGNLAGGIGKDQLACPAGAQPSPFNDERKAAGTATVARASGPDLVVTPSITYTVKDTIDLCPGDCGTALEQIATVPLSQFEATGISGDVPFTVEFPAPSLPPFTVSAPLPPTPAPSPTPSPKPAKGP